MTAMLATVLMFAVLNYALKSSGPVLLTEHRIPEDVEAIIEALPASLLTGMLVSGLVGERWSSLDPAVLAGLCGAAVTWSLRAPHLLSVGTALLVVVAVRWSS